MARRKNTKRIDPRYFLHETVNRGEEEPLEEFLGFSKKEKLAKKVKEIIAMIDKAGGKYGGRSVPDIAKEEFAIAIAKGANPRTAKMSYPQAVDALDLEQAEYRALRTVYGDEKVDSSADFRAISDKATAGHEAHQQVGKDRAAAAAGADDLKQVFRSFDRARDTLKKNMQTGQPGLAKELLRNAHMAQKYAQGRDKQKLAKVMQALEKFAGEAGIGSRARKRRMQSDLTRNALGQDVRTFADGSTQIDKTGRSGGYKE